MLLMEIKVELETFKKKIDKEIEAFFDRVIRETSKKDPFVTDNLRYAKKMAMAGGKRIRPALMYWGYIGSGGEEKEKIIKASVAIELIHLFLLIHDDIIDRDSKRHNIDTMHSHYRGVGKRIFPRADFEHFGNSIAIISGDMIGALGNQILFSSDFEPELIMKALSHLQSVVSMTVIGQAKDIYMEYKGKSSPEEVLQMYEYKTARYTIEGPLQLGAILGGADRKTIEDMSVFSRPMGVAFQIQDDILGIFGTEKKIGKSIGADIKEGKQTLLLVKALELADKNQKRGLLSCLGNSLITKKDIIQFREIVVQTGALDFTKSLARELIKEAKEEITKTRIKKDAKDFLLSLAGYMMDREV